MSDSANSQMPSKLATLESEITELEADLKSFKHELKECLAYLTDLVQTSECITAANDTLPRVRAVENQLLYLHQQKENSLSYKLKTKIRSKLWLK